MLVCCRHGNTGECLVAAAALLCWQPDSPALHDVPMLVQAHIMGLIDAVALQDVALQSVQDIRCARARHAFARVDWTRLVKHLNEDLTAANQLLPAHKHISLVHVPNSSSRPSSH